mmetsp:Transcript_8770/g.25505  ORF Transcript_8770/g.25505 Transcript_8770/m.25505 type:complete len:733 (-) Transcript_8770:64-2262(-)
MSRAVVPVAGEISTWHLSRECGTAPALDAARPGVAGNEAGFFEAIDFGHQALPDDDDSEPSPPRALNALSLSSLASGDHYGDALRSWRDAQGADPHGIADETLEKPGVPIASQSQHPSPRTATRCAVPRSVPIHHAVSAGASALSDGSAYKSAQLRSSMRSSVSLEAQSQRLSSARGPSPMQVPARAFHSAGRRRPEDVRNAASLFGDRPPSRQRPPHEAMFLSAVGAAVSGGASRANDDAPGGGAGSPGDDVETGPSPAPVRLFAQRPQSRGKQPGMALHIDGRPETNELAGAGAGGLGSVPDGCVGPGSELAALLRPPTSWADSTAVRDRALGQDAERDSAHTAARGDHTSSMDAGAAFAGASKPVRTLEEHLNRRRVESAARMRNHCNRCCAGVGDSVSGLGPCGACNTGPGGCSAGAGLADPFLHALRPAFTARSDAGPDGETAPSGRVRTHGAGGKAGGVSVVSDVAFGGFSPRTAAASAMSERPGTGTCNCVSSAARWDAAHREPAGASRCGTGGCGCGVGARAPGGRGMEHASRGGQEPLPDAFSHSDPGRTALPLPAGHRRIAQTHKTHRTERTDRVDRASHGPRHAHRQVAADAHGAAGGRPLSAVKHPGFAARSRASVPSTTISALHARGTPPATAGFGADCAKPERLAASCPASTVNAGEAYCHGNGNCGLVAFASSLSPEFLAMFAPVDTPVTVDDSDVDAAGESETPGSRVVYGRSRYA